MARFVSFRCPLSTEQDEIMIEVDDKVESIKRLRFMLEERGLTQFRSIGDINVFLENFDMEVDRIRKEGHEKVLREKEELMAAKKTLDHEKGQIVQLVNKEYHVRIDFLNQSIQARRMGKQGGLSGVINAVIEYVLKFRRKKLQKSHQKRINTLREDMTLKSNDLALKIENYTANGQYLVEQSVASKLKNHRLAKAILEELNPLIAGAIGESKVENELRSLSCKGVLLNDYSLEFHPPIYNRSENDRIYSIQVDHLLVTQAGIFALETKNWSKKSVESVDLRSPIAQVMRSSYALFVLVNSADEKALGTMIHHWGEKKIPIRSVIVMVGHKPQVEFKYVKVKSLNEVNRYIQYFDPIFSEGEMKGIVSYLKEKKRRNGLGVSIGKGSRSRHRKMGMTINDLYKG